MKRCALSPRPTPACKPPSQPAPRRSSGSGSTTTRKAARAKPDADGRQEWLWFDDEGDALTYNLTEPKSLAAGEWILEATLYADGTCALPAAAQQGAFLKRAPEAVKLAHETTMESIDVNGVGLSGAEIWPFIAGQPQPYPNGVLWGFEPRDATPAVIACAKHAWGALKFFMGGRPARDAQSRPARRDLAFLPVGPMTTRALATTHLQRAVGAHVELAEQLLEVGEQGRPRRQLHGPVAQTGARGAASGHRIASVILTP